MYIRPIWPPARTRRVATLLTAGALAFTGVLSVPAVAPANASTPPVIGRAGALKTRPQGMPTTGVAARQLASASVSARFASDRTTATIRLRQAPTAAQGATLRVGLGVVNDGNCEEKVAYSTPTHGSPASGWSRHGRTYTLSSRAKSVPYTINCAGALVEAADQDPVYDVLIDRLHKVYAKPKLKITTARLLGKKKLKLVPKVWTPIEVRVRNDGQADAKHIVVTGHGKRVRVKKKALHYPLSPGDHADIKVQVKLTRKRRTKVRFKARSGTVTTHRKFRIRPTKAPRRIRNGRYHSRDHRVRFRVRHHHIVKFRVHVRTVCGGYPGIPTYTWNWYSMPKMKVRRSGIVDATHKGRHFRATLEGRAFGSHVTATFDYSGPGSCRAHVKFTARRNG